MRRKLLERLLALPTAISGVREEVEAAYRQSVSQTGSLVLCGGLCGETEVVVY
jgi:hypothetical protein